MLRALTAPSLMFPEPLACKKCREGGNTQCIDCDLGYKNFDKQEGSTITCKTCQEYDSRLYTKSDGSCKGNSNI